MARLGSGADGMAKAIGIATLAPGGSVAVPAALILDEVEHHRAGWYWQGPFLCRRAFTDNLGLVKKRMQVPPGGMPDCDIPRRNWVCAREHR